MKAMWLTAIGNMILDAIIIGLMVSLVLIVTNWEDAVWKVICLALIFVAYGTIHGIITMKRMGYRG